MLIATTGATDATVPLGRAAAGRVRRAPKAEVGVQSGPFGLVDRTMTGTGPNQHHLRVKPSTTRALWQPGAAPRVPSSPVPSVATAEVEPQPKRSRSRCPTTIPAIDDDPEAAHIGGRALALRTVGCRCMRNRMRARVPMVTEPI